MTKKSTITAALILIFLFAVMPMLSCEDNSTDNENIMEVFAPATTDITETTDGGMPAGLNRVQREVRYQSLAMLRNHKFAAALVEMLFLTNPDEYETACDPATIQRSADAIAAGIAAWVEAQAKFAD